MKSRISAFLLLCLLVPHSYAEKLPASSHALRKKSGLMVSQPHGEELRLAWLEMLKQSKQNLNTPAPQEPLQVWMVDVDMNVPKQDHLLVSKTRSMAQHLQFLLPKGVIDIAAEYLVVREKREWGDFSTTIDGVSTLLDQFRISGDETVAADLKGIIEKCDAGFWQHPLFEDVFEVWIKTGNLETILQFVAKEAGDKTGQRLPVVAMLVEDYMDSLDSMWGKKQERAELEATVSDLKNLREASSEVLAHFQ